MGENRFVRLWVVCFLLVGFTFLLFQPALADVGEVEMDQGGITETDPDDGSKGEAISEEDNPWWKDILNGIGEWTDKGMKAADDFGDMLKSEWESFKDSAEDKWEEFKNKWDEFLENTGEFLNDTKEGFFNAVDAVGDFFVDAWEWVKDNEWIQTIAAAVLATGAIVLGALVLTATLPAWGTIALIGAGALAGGFLYQWAASSSGAEYSFGQALTWAFLGGFTGGVAQSTGVLGFLTRTGWGALRSFVSANYSIGFGALLKNAGVGAVANGIMSGISSYLQGSNIIFSDLALDVISGGLTGLIFGPFAQSIGIAWRNRDVVKLLKFGSFSSIYAGLDNFIFSGFKGEWDPINIAVGMLVGGAAFVAFSKFTQFLTRSNGIDNTVDSTTVDEIITEVTNKIPEEITKKGLEEVMENQTKRKAVKIPKETTINAVNE